MKSTQLLLIIGSLVAFSQWTPADGIKANFFDKVGAALKVKRKNYGIVIDAGSTGSRALVYEFISSRCGDVVKLHKEFFHETQPGLSDFVTNPEGAARSIQKLLLMAKQDIPRRHWAETFVTLMATAGLRLLPQQQQEQLLKCVNKTLVNSGFRTGPDSVSIIDGQYEGLLSWFSINLLLDTFERRKSYPVAALDMGGASTQVTFVPFVQDFVPFTQIQFLYNIVAYHKLYTVYSRSFLGLGLNEARLRILKLGANRFQTNFRTVCLNPHTKTNWTYRGVTYTVEGKDPSVRGTPITSGISANAVNYRACEDVIQFVILNNFQKIVPPRNQNIFAFSGYYYTVLEAGIIPPQGGALFLYELIINTKQFCFLNNSRMPFLCMDLIYIIVLLRDLYGLSVYDKIMFVKTIHGHQVNWALAVAFLNLYASANQKKKIIHNF
ncbi:hypothetical protein RUM44_008218 [Polyplax serrata]|uniref:Ectonucleoside triphosphate diphosphohydrolase 5 n=1 Tax=Polyplax serrata TaxID=468196 RepID=A0ABR1BBN6_POLSC